MWTTLPEECSEQAPRRWLRRSGLLVVAAAIAVCTLGSGALADGAPIASTAALPWSDPNHQTPTELLAGQIASHIANRAVSVNCEGATDWATLVAQYGGDPNAESGYVATEWNSATGQLVNLSSVAMLASDVCLPIDQFGQATIKPTKCVPAPAQARLVAKSAHTLQAAGSRARRKLATRPAAAAPARQPGPCYLGNGKTAAPMPASYWTNYSIYAFAILTLAHEAVHLGGIVGGTLVNGEQVGDPQAEAKADCYGMQWMPYVAEQLGDTADDAQAIAEYFWDQIYPLVQTADPSYWSADCRPGGALDIRPPGTTAWP